jgi:acyl-coenzyme A synthetase/AMP-(fatty) acid ligase
VEQAVVLLDEVASAACVGVGSQGDQQVVVVVTGPHTKSVVASSELTTRVRLVSGVDVAAVLIREELPVDIRHNAKINRTALAVWADDVLSGHSR